VLVIFKTDVSAMLVTRTRRVSRRRLPREATPRQNGQHSAQGNQVPTWIGERAATDGSCVIWESGLPTPTGRFESWKDQHKRNRRQSDLEIDHCTLESKAEQKWTSFVSYNQCYAIYSRGRQHAQQGLSRTHTDDLKR
jgi:hypothetical protein